MAKLPGLGIFVFLVGSGRMRTWREEARRAPGRWLNLRGAAEGMAIWSSTAASRPSGNDAFDVYRKGELDHLEAQGKEFQAFLDRLRLARHKEEFDGFMAEQWEAQGTCLPSKHGGA